MTQKEKDQIIAELSTVVKKIKDHYKLGNNYTNNILSAVENAVDKVKLIEVK